MEEGGYTPVATPSPPQRLQHGRGRLYTRRYTVTATMTPAWKREVIHPSLHRPATTTPAWKREVIHPSLHRHRHNDSSMEEGGYTPVATPSPPQRLQHGRGRLYTRRYTVTATTTPAWKREVIHPSLHRHRHNDSSMEEGGYTPVATPSPPQRLQHGRGRLYTRRYTVTATMTPAWKREVIHPSLHRHRHNDSSMEEGGYTPVATPSPPQRLQHGRGRCYTVTATMTPAWKREVIHPSLHRHRHNDSSMEEGGYTPVATPSPPQRLQHGRGRLYTRRYTVTATTTPAWKREVIHPSLHRHRHNDSSMEEGGYTPVATPSPPQ